MPSPAWNDTFAAGDTWQTKSFFDMFLKAAWERLRATATVTTLPDEAHQRLARLFDPGPPAVPADVAQSARVANATPHFQAFGDGILLPSVRALQQAANAMIPLFWNPSVAVAGQTIVAGPPFTTAYQIGPRGGIWDGYTLTAAIGLSGGELLSNSLGLIVDWRRCCPREVWADNIQGMTKDQRWFYRTGFDDWSPTDQNTVPTGSRARWMKHPGTAGSYPATVHGGSLRPNPGTAQPGVWEHQGSGVWTKVDDVFAQPDTLDSENSPTGGTFTDPGEAVPGDIAGPWLFTNLRDVFNLMVWVVPKQFPFYQVSTTPAVDPTLPASTYVDAATPGVNIAVGQSPIGEPDEATAKADALTAFATAAAAPTYFLATTIRQEGLVNNGWNATLQGSEFYLGCGNVWQGRARTVEFYLMAQFDPTFPDDLYDGTAFGVALTQDVWGLYEAASRAAGADAYAVELSAQVRNYDIAPWPADPVTTTKRLGAYTGRDNTFFLVKYDVAGGFDFTAST